MRDVDFIKAREGLRLKSYQDSGGVWTIGYGHTGTGAEPGREITADEADSLFDADLEIFRAAVDKSVTVPLSENQRAALVSFCFNVGAPRFETSTLLKKLNAGDYAGAAAEFPKWNKVRGNVDRGLINRRKAERALFLSGTDLAPEPYPEEPPMLPFVAAALPALINAAPDLIRIFGGGEQSEKNAKAAEKVVEIAKGVTGTETAEQAVQKIQTDPASEAEFRKAAMAQFLDIEKLADARVEKARAFNAAEQPVFGAWKFVHILSMLVVLAAVAAIGYILGTSDDPTERSMALQTLLLTGFGGVLMYWLGSSDGSAKKTEMMRRN